MALTRCAAIEAAPHGVRVNAVAPILAMHPFLAKVTHRRAARRADDARGVRPRRRAVGGRQRDRVPRERLLVLHDRRGRLASAVPARRDGRPAMHRRARRHRRGAGRRRHSTSATATGSRSPRSASTCSPTRPATTSGSTSTSSGPRPRARSAGRSPTATSRCRCSNLLLPQIARGAAASQHGRQLRHRQDPLPRARSRSARGIRAGAELVERRATSRGGVQTMIRITIEVEGSDKPVCVIESLSRYLA